ncbi:MAG: hypothetical protein ACKVW3_00140 [Phycisphaerales bacterium]
MVELFFGGGAAWYGVPALVGTIFFLFRVVMLLTGGGHHDVAADAHFDTGDAHHDSGGDFQILSIQSVAAFMMGFGWGGLGALKGTSWSWAISVAVAVACGVAMVWLLAILLKGMSELQSSGTVRLDSTVGREGEVYLSVPSNREGTGQVRVSLTDRQRIFNAVSENEPLPTGTRVRIISANTDNTVTVARA